MLLRGRSDDGEDSGGGEGVMSVQAWIVLRQRCKSVECTTGPFDSYGVVARHLESHVKLDSAEEGHTTTLVCLDAVLSFLLESQHFIHP